MLGHRALGLAALLLFGCTDARQINFDAAARQTALGADVTWIPRGTLSGGPRFGEQLAASGNTLLVGGFGFVDVFSRTDQGWSKQQTLSPSSADTNFGTSLAIDGDTALIGSSIGAQVYVNAAGSWQEQLPPLVSAGADLYGGSVALSGGTAVLSNRQGDIQVFSRSGGAWEAVQPLVSDGQSGFWVAISSQRIFLADTRYKDTYDGVVSVFHEASGVWAEETTLFRPEPFGQGLAADSATLVVGAYGHTYAYDLVEPNWSTPQVLDAPISNPYSGFGASVAVAADILLSAAPAADPPYADVWQNVAGTWIERQLLSSPDPSALYTYAWSVGIAAGDLLVAAPEAHTGAVEPGVVFVFGGCTADASCAAEQYCGGDGYCHPQKPLAAPCAPDVGQDCKSSGCRVCASGSCVDGVCCDTPCDGRCESCIEPDRVGVCTLVSGAPRGGRPACESDGTQCGGACDGSGRDCSYRAANEPCGSSCDNGIETPQTCNGTGACVTRTSRVCLAYACDGPVCGTDCVSDADCLAGYHCANAQCVASTTANECSADAASSIGDAGATACEPYTCDRATGLCRSECTVQLDCAEAFICDTASKACVSREPEAVATSGCDCRFGRVQRSHSELVLLGLIVLAALRRRGNTTLS